MRFFSALALALAAPFATASGDGEYEWGGMFEVADFTTIQW